MKIGTEESSIWASLPPERWERRTPLSGMLKADRSGDPMEETYEQTTERLERDLSRLRAEELAAFLRRESEAMYAGPRPFAQYMRMRCKEKGILQQTLFLRADIPENYGYKLISGEKHTRRRDVILRLCLAAAFSVKETDEALTLYGMAPLHPRIPRDAVLIAAIGNRMYEIEAVDELLRTCGQPPLQTAGTGGGRETAE